MLHQQYYVELEKYNKLIGRKNVKADSYNGIYDRYQYPVLTREHIPLHWRYDLNPETNPYFMERLGVNAVMNSGAIELDGKYYLSLAWQRATMELMVSGSGSIRFFCRIPARRRLMSTTCV